MRALALLAILFVILPLIVFAAGQFGLLAGRAPTEPGLKDGKLRPPHPMSPIGTGAEGVE